MLRIDPDRIRTAEAQASAALAAWRASASLPVTDFALAALAAGLVTPEEAEAWATGKQLPASVTSALGNLPAKDRVPARIRALASVSVHRSHPLIALIAAHMGLTDDAVDALFGGPPS